MSLADLQQLFAGVLTRFTTLERSISRALPIPDEIA